VGGRSGQLRSRCAVALPLLLAVAAGCEQPKVVPQQPPSPARPADAGPRDPGPVPPPAPNADAFTVPATPDAGGADVVAGARCPGGATTAPANCAALGVTVAAPFAGTYTCHDLGPVPGVPPQKYGGLTLTTDDCSTKLLIGGAANFPEGKIYAVTVVRDAAGHISGFQGTASVFADAPWNDGGLTYGPEGVLFATRWPRNELQQTRPGSAAADKVTDLTALGVQHASASLNFVPRGLPGAGALKLVSWSGGQWYTLGLRADGAGMFEVTGATAGPPLPGGPEGFVYVARGSPLFTADSMLVSEWSANQIAVYEIDGKGDPRLPTRRNLLTGLHGAEGAYRDPATGDFFFSTWGQEADRVIVVRGFAPIVID
jgi:hypothetical protein